jgi:caa(3)-type oxidase subunit IV
MPTLIATLLVLAVAQATLGVVYFMHLRYERAILGWSLMSALVFVLVLLNQVWPDALRLYRLRLHE